MSQHVPGALKTFKAAADYSAKQYYAMYVSSDNTVTISSAASDALVGTLLNEPKANEGAVIAMSGTSKAIAGGTVNIGDRITADSAGKLVATTTANQNIIGTAIEAADSGDIFEYVVGLSEF
jgi:hypothetical protein